MIVAGTGHRPQKLGGFHPANPIRAKLKAEISFALKELNPEYVISGMALGFDQWLAETCVEIGIPFVAAVPCDGQDAIWPQKSKDVYQSLLAKAREIVVVSPGPYEHWKMHARNKWMSDRCNLLLAAFDGSPGGTAACVKYATAVGCSIRYLKW